MNIRFLQKLCIGALAGLISIPASAINYQSRYNELIQGERKSREEVAETFASGAAALVIGLYGYYNDPGNISTKVVYSLTQTTGIVLVSNAMRDAYTPSFLLSQDRYFRKEGNLDYLKFKKGVVRITDRQALAQTHQIAYTSGILSLLYFYNGYREAPQNKTVQNVFYFLGFNFLLVSGFSFYKIFDAENSFPAAENYLPEGMELSFLPMPQISYEF